MSFADSEGKRGQTGQSGQNTGNRGQTETAADVYQGSAEEGTRGTAPRVREKTYSKEELGGPSLF